jgi:trigger factor
MNVTVEELSPCRKRLKIEIPPNRVNEAIEKVTDDYQKAAHIPGFRPGKAPRTVIAKKFSKDIESEMQRTLVPEACREVIKEKKLNVVSRPEIEDLKFQRGLSLSFSTVVELAPEFKLPDYKGLSIKKAERDVKPEEIEMAITSILEQHASFIDVDPHPLVKDDFAVINFSAVSEGKALKELLPPAAASLAESHDFWLWVKDEAFLPKFADQCIGMNVGERREVAVEFPADFRHKEVAGKKASYTVELKQIKARKLPELNDAFTQELAKINVDEFRNRMKESLVSQKVTQADQNEKGQLVEKLLQGVNFELPPTVVAEETSQTVYDIVAENQARGIPVSLLEEKKTEIYSNATKTAQERVKLTFVARKIADEEKITVTQDELVERLQLLAAQQQMPLEQLVKKVSENGAIASIEERLLLGKVLDFLLKNAKAE